MIQRSADFDLGQDKTRIKDPKDADRQHVTVDAILERFFQEDLQRRYEIQILADEVGMGKTFVALGVAYTLLKSLRTGTAPDDLQGCAKKILIITPNNSALFNKWQREVGEFVKRCVKPEYQADEVGRFSAVQVDRLDELVRAVSRRGGGPRVIITNMGVFGSRRFQHYDLKRRFLLGLLFRHWGPRFKGSSRTRLLKGAPDGWPSDPKQLEHFTDDEWARIPFDPKELRKALRRLDRRDDAVKELLETCREIAEPYARDREEKFKKVEKQLMNVYRGMLPLLIRQSFPLVVVDEAHNWKNGPLKGANGYDGFVDTIARRARRVLLLTATPFQLRPEEMLEILKISDQLKVSPNKDETEQRRQHLAKLREEVIRPVLKNSAAASRAFTRAWSRLPRTVTRSELANVWNSETLIHARERLYQMAVAPQVVSSQEIDVVIERAVASLDPNLRQLMREGLKLYTHNADLSQELGSLVIRHRRKTDHRRFLVGAEFNPEHDGLSRPDRHLLHAAPGLDVRGDGELPHYVLMRCVSEMKHGKGRSSLGSTLTGCYSTLLHSSEGRQIQRCMKENPNSSVYFNLLMKMVGARHDAHHPKVKEVARAALHAWRDGEKFLVFCFRTNTAERLREIIDRRIRAELAKRSERCLGSPDALKTLRSRLTGRDRDLVVLGLDRVLWSILWANPWDDQGGLCSPEQLRLTEEDLREIARMSLTFGVGLTGERVDRVFLHRATEFAIARRLLRETRLPRPLGQILSAMGEPEWVSDPYGVAANVDTDDRGAEQTHFDERGVHTRYTAAAVPEKHAVEALAGELAERRQRGRRQDQVSILDGYAEGPSLWLGPNPVQAFPSPAGTASSRMAQASHQIHHHLFELTHDGGEPDWLSRRMVFQALRRAVLRESVLLRLLPSSTNRDEGSWGELLVRAFFDPMPGQRESMADRISVFLEDLRAASGSLHDSTSARFALYQATQLRDQQAVALVKGETGEEVRERVFAGFNTPLLPEVLICTSIGQEGIDLHRHCRQVVHYDLAWNPAVLEQRTGRVDRIGSKTFRERSLVQGPAGPFLEVGVPFLAGTYDERMYEELRLRAQTFEVLTGGRLAADSPEGLDEKKHAEGKEAGLSFTSLPEQMVNDLRVKLHIWSDHENVASRPAGSL
ncbi:MAG: helicase-related protein [Thermoguttaceae bacterium]|jgi:hypothetical protein